MNFVPEFITTDANVLKQVLTVVVVRLLGLIAGLKGRSLRPLDVTVHMTDVWKTTGSYSFSSLWSYLRMPKEIR